MIYNRNPYTGSSKKKIIIRIIIVVAALLAVSAATFAFGNYLKAKAEATTVSGTGAGRGEADTSGVGREPSGEAAQAKSVRSACVALSTLSSAEKARDHVDRLATKGYTGVTVVLVGRDGYLTYTSDAVAAYTKQKIADIKDAAIVSAVTEQAKKHSMRTSAVIFAAADFTSNDVGAKIDSIVAADAVRFGFDEIVAVLPLEAESLDSILASSAVKYLTALGDEKGSAALGSALPADVFKTPSLSPQVELFASVCDFLAIDLTAVPASEEAAKKSVGDTLEALSGYFTMYELRVLFDGGDKKIADAEVKALSDGGFSNYMFVTATELSGDEDTADTDDGGDDGGYDPYVPDDPGYPDDQPSYEPEPEVDTEAPADEPVADTEAPDVSPDQPDEPPADQPAEPDQPQTPDDGGDGEGGGE